MNLLSTVSLRNGRKMLANEGSCMAKSFHAKTLCRKARIATVETRMTNAYIHLSLLSKWLLWFEVPLSLVNLMFFFAFIDKFVIQEN